ncbi:MAG: FtsX-like permease family protein [Bacteroidales bacterium]
MLKHYIKMSWKVLLRRPFYTVISLVGISFTLMILMILVAFYEHSLAPNGIMKNFDRVLSINRVVLSNTEKGSMWSSSAGYFLIKEYVKKMKTPAEISLTTSPMAFKIFNDGRKFELLTRFTDAQFWHIFDFEFIRGRAFNENEVINADPVAVIDDKSCIDYFGSVDVIGKSLKINDLEYKIVGVVKNIPIIRIQGFAQVYLPYTRSKFNLNSNELIGGFDCNLMARDKNGLKAMQEEWKRILPQIKITDGYNKIECNLETLLDTVRGQLLPTSKQNSVFAAILLLFLVLFMSLPSLNLVNLNITRILERSSEIGIRKSFGASSRILVFQFIVENIVLTAIGGALGLILAYTVLKIIDASGAIPNSHFGINFDIFIYSLVLTLFFALLSGVYPAWKMSRMNIMNALKEEKI